MKKLFIVTFVNIIMITTKICLAEDRYFHPNTLIIPQDTVYQDNQMYKSFGLLYDLLKKGVHVNWAILPGKNYDDIDFTVAQVYSKAGGTGGTVINNASYKAGPFLVSSEFYGKALPIVQSWENKGVVVHRALTLFVAPVYKVLKAAPTIGVFVDGNEIIATTYLNAAEIPDSNGNPWPSVKDKTGKYPGYPDMLNVSEIEGPTTTNHRDGALFDQFGNPVYCQLMSMHYDDNGHSSEVVAEIREFLKFPTHFFAECQAITTFENDINGLFLTINGLSADNDPRQNVFFFNSDNPFAQNTGPFKTGGGSVPSFKLSQNSSYRLSVVRMVSGNQTTPGSKDVWIVGNLEDNENYGKISYLSGHQYTTSLPFSSKDTNKGTRYFLNSLFEAPCASDEGMPNFIISKEGPSYTTNPIITYVISLTNIGPGFATSVYVEDILPPNTRFISASNGGTHNNGKVIWNLGNVLPYISFELSLTIELLQFGNYENDATVYYKSGINQFSKKSEKILTSFLLPAGTVPDGKNHSGLPLYVYKLSESELYLDWDITCNAVDYSIHIGNLPLNDAYNHTSLICSTNGETSYNINIGNGNYYFLIVANNGITDGSYGQDSKNNQRPVGLNYCKPQAIGNCN